MLRGNFCPIIPCIRYNYFLSLNCADEINRAESFFSLSPPPCSQRRQSRLKCFIMRTTDASDRGIIEITSIDNQGGSSHGKEGREKQSSFLKLKSHSSNSSSVLAMLDFMVYRFYLSGEWRKLNKKELSDRLFFFSFFFSHNFTFKLHV